MFTHPSQHQIMIFMCCKYDLQEASSFLATSCNSCLSPPCLMAICQGSLLLSGYQCWAAAQAVHQVRLLKSSLTPSPLVCLIWRAEIFRVELGISQLLPGTQAPNSDPVQTATEPSAASSSPDTSYLPVITIILLVGRRGKYNSPIYRSQIQSTLDQCWLSQT